MEKKFEIFGQDVLRKSNELEFDKLKYNEIELIKVEEDIILWKKRKDTSNKWYYFYTNLKGDLLFDGKLFSYATPFSKSKAFVIYNNQKLLLDLKTKEIVYLPKEIHFKHINGFREENLVLFHQRKWKWGSIEYNYLEHTFEQNIPFIWDALEFSRFNNEVYVGLHQFHPIQVELKKGYWREDFGDLFVIPVFKMPLSMAYNLDYYRYVKYKSLDSISLVEIRDIKEKISSIYSKEQRKEMVKEFISTSYPISDVYFEECSSLSQTTNKGVIVENESLDEYKRVLGRMKF